MVDFEFYDRKWDARVPVIAEFHRRLFLAVAALPAFDDHIVLIGAVVDAEGTNEKLSKRVSGLLAEGWHNKF